MRDHADIAVVGAGAAGMFAAIWAARTRPGASIVALDGAARLGAKVLVAGGGRCNVTHHAVDESSYAGSSRHAVRKVLGRFGVDRTVEFFGLLGVHLKREETGKLFPTTDDAHTVLDALLAEIARLRIELRHPWRVAAVRADAGRFVIESAEVPPRVLSADRVILATGGKALPKTGSDGGGYELARGLGHTLTPRVFPALVPLTLAKGCFLLELSGVTVPAALRLVTGAGKMLAEFTDSLLITHVGLSGPAAMDISRYYTAARGEDAGATLELNLCPGTTLDTLDSAMARAGGVAAARYLTSQSPPRPHVPGHPDQGMPERLARALCEASGVEPGAMLGSLTREKRRGLAAAATALPLPVTGDRGFTFAEVTAGGVPLAEVKLETMESRVCPGLHLCGEILDVDGRIGGFNFQWAWSSGYAAGCGAAAPRGA